MRTRSTFALGALALIGFAASLTGCSSVPERGAACASNLGTEGMAARDDEESSTAPAKTYSVFGAVSRIGSRAYPDDLTLYEAVMAAEPDRSRADLTQVKVFRSASTPRGGATEITFDVSPVEERGDSSVNIHIEPGDVIYVPAAPAAPTESAR